MSSAQREGWAKDFSRLGREHFKKARGAPPRKTTHPILQIKFHTVSRVAFRRTEPVWASEDFFVSSLLPSFIFVGYLMRFPVRGVNGSFLPQLRGLLRKLLCVHGGSEMSEK